VLNTLLLPQLKLRDEYGNQNKKAEFLRLFYFDMLVGTV